MFSNRRAVAGVENEQFLFSIKTTSETVDAGACAWVWVCWGVRVRVRVRVGVGVSAGVGGCVGVGGCGACGCWCGCGCVSAWMACVLCVFCASFIFSSLFLRFFI